MSTDLHLAPIWQAGLCERRIYIKTKIETPEGEIKIRSKPLDLLYVVLRRSERECIAFCVNRRKGRLTFTDHRERFTGTAGTQGRWGNLPPQKPGRSRSLTPTAWKAEVSRLIGTERAEEILRLLGA